MSSQKQRNRARRRAEKLMDTALAAVHDGRLIKAERNSLQAIEIGRVNPRLWLDHGRVMRAVGKMDEATEAVRQAIALAPKYAEAFAELASMQAGLGKLAQALRLQTRAVELAPKDKAMREGLATFAAQLPADGGPVDAGAPEAAAPPDLHPRFARYDALQLDEELRQTGMVHLPDLLDPEECAALRACWEDEDLFEHTRSLDSEEAGRCSYRFFHPPLPPLVAELREHAYTLLAPIANGWQEDFKRSQRFPLRLAEFVEQCHAHGQSRSTPILLRYPPGGFNAPHQDIAGKLVFPFQLAVTLGPGCKSQGGGGEFRLVDARHGKKARERRCATGLGDGVVFCTRERPVRIAGVLGLQPVRHGVAEVGELERFALGIPMHEHR